MVPNFFDGYDNEDPSIKVKLLGSFFKNGF